MQFTDYLALVAGRPANANMASIEAGLIHGRRAAGLTTAVRIVHYVAQLAHESGRFRYDEEVWGPTPAQARYDTRTDLGNTAARDGDGFTFRGRTGIQITGGHNYREFRDWCREFVDADAPDFEADPDRVLTDPWEGLGPIWYWSTRGLNRYADAGNVEMVTRRINGGLNGYADRLTLLDRAALALIGYEPADVMGFQRIAHEADPRIVVDGLSGPQTRAAMHAVLLKTDLPFWTAPAGPVPPPPDELERLLTGGEDLIRQGIDMVARAADLIRGD